VSALATDNTSFILFATYFKFNTNFQQSQTEVNTAFFLVTRPAHDIYLLWVLPLTLNTSPSPMTLSLVISYSRPRKMI